MEQLMKKTATTLFGLLLMSTAFAEVGVNGLVLDSTYTTYQDGIRIGKTVYEYNSKKQVTAIYDYGYDGDIATLTSRTVNTYNGNDQLLKQESYELMEEDFVLASVIEYSNWDEKSNEPGGYIYYALDEEDPAAGLQLSIKQEAFFDSEGKPVDYHIYQWDAEIGDWTLSAKGQISYNDQGQISELFTSMDYEGFSVQNTATYEYDSHGSLTKETTTQTLNGYPMGSTVYSYVNEYYDDGNLKTVTETPDDSELSTIEYYFWGKGNTTRVNTIEDALRKTGIYFDLSGRSYNGTPTEPGIYIIGNRKVVVK